MYWNALDHALFSTQSNAITLLDLPAIHGMAQDFQDFGVVNGGMPQVQHSDFGTKLRGLWCFGIQSDIIRECLFLANKSGFQTWGSRPTAYETSVEGGVLVVRSQLCPWSTLNVNNTNRIATTDPIRYQRLLEDSLSNDARRTGVMCKYCATLEEDLASSVELKDRLVDEKWDDVNFKQVDQFLTRTFKSSPDLDSRKRKFGMEDWENDRALVLLRMNELNIRATRAEQRVLELEQILRDHVLAASDGDDSDILNPLLQQDCTEEQSMLVCKLPGCNKSFKSKKTFRRHLIQKHSDNARFLVCNQPTLTGAVCRFETVHSGVLSYHRKHSLAHQRREDWNISCPFCQSKFARQHEMDRHQRICKARPFVPQISANGTKQLNEHSTESLSRPQEVPSFVADHNHQHYNLVHSNLESNIVI